MCPLYWRLRSGRGDHLRRVETEKLDVRRWSSSELALHSVSHSSTYLRIYAIDPCASSSIRYDRVSWSPPSASCSDRRAPGRGHGGRGFWEIFVFGEGEHGGLPAWTSGDKTAMVGALPVLLINFRSTVCSLIITNNWNGCCSCCLVLTRASAYFWGRSEQPSDKIPEKPGL